jgi:ribokinase
MSHEILVIGSLNMDLVVTAPHLPQRGETVLGGRFNTFPGGKGANQAAAAALAGGQVAMLGKVGADDFGRQLIQSLQSFGVSTEPVGQQAGAATGVALITVDEHGDNTIVVVPGANGAVTGADLEQAEALIAGARLLVLQLEVPLETVDRAVNLANQHAVPVALNAAPAGALSARTLAGLDYLILNETELQQVSLHGNSADLGAACQHLLDAGVQHVVVTLGQQGVYVHDWQEQFRLPAHQVEVVDSTAAGDAFVGAFCAALVRGETLRQAAAWGNAAGALAVTKAGAQPSLPTRTEIQRLLSQEAPA